MKREYDFSKAKRGAVLAADAKTRITTYLDDVVIECFKALSEETGNGCLARIGAARRST